jgi:hypothetical protein
LGLGIPAEESRAAARDGHAPARPEERGAGGRGTLNPTPQLGRHPAHANDPSPGGVQAHSAEELNELDQVVAVIASCVLRGVALHREVVQKSLNRLLGSRSRLLRFCTFSP